MCAKQKQNDPRGEQSQCVLDVRSHGVCVGEPHGPHPASHCECYTSLKNFFKFKSTLLTIIMSLGQCLDDVIKAHDMYLNEILDRALLAPQHEMLNMQVRLNDFIALFCITY